jgi:hypothetical protein
MHLSSSPRRPSTCATRAWFRMEKRTDQLDQRPDYILIERVRPRKEVDNCCSRKKGFRGRSPSKRDQNARASKRPIADAQRVKNLGSRTPKTKTYPAITPSFFHFGFVSTTFFSVTGSGNSITIGLIDNSTFQNTATLLPYNLVSQIAYKHTRLQAKSRSSRLQDVLGQPINTQSTEQDDLAGGLAHLPDFFLFLALPPGLVDRVNVLVRELDVADAEVTGQSVGSRRGGYDDGAE